MKNLLVTGGAGFIGTNIVGTHTLLKAAKKLWLDAGKTEYRFHHISTGEVYGTLRPNDPPFTELPPYAPNSPAAKNIHPNNLITHVKDRAGHDRRYAINAKK